MKDDGERGEPEGRADNAPTHRPRRRVVVLGEASAVFAVLVIALALRLPTLHQPLLERHGFRQTQTAYTAVLYHEDGIDLLHPKLPVLGKPFEVPFEFPLFQALAAGAMSWGLPADVAMRSTALACFFVSSLLLWGLVRHIAGSVAGFVGLVFFSFTPFSLMWSRASLIEYLAVAGSLGWLWAGLAWRERPRPAWAAAALAAGLVAMLVKPTTAAFWVVPLLAFPLEAEEGGWRGWLRARRNPVLLAIIAVPFIAALLWTHHADAIKASNPGTAWLTGNALQQWNFGTVHQRLISSSWTTIAGRIQDEVTVVPAWLVPLTVFVGFGTRYARFWAAVAAVPVLTVLTFWNLYVVHDYYLAAITPVLAAVLGVAFSRGWQAMSGFLARGAAIGLLAVLIVVVLAGNPADWGVVYRPIKRESALPALSETPRFTRPSDLVVFEGFDWSPELPYYSRRSGFMLRVGQSTGEREVAARLPSLGYTLLVTKRLESDLAAGAVRGRRWTGVLGKWLYITADDAFDLRGAPVAATDSLDLDLGNDAKLLLQGPLTVPCGSQGVRIPRGTGVTILRFATDTSRSAKLSVNAQYADIPARGFVLFRSVVAEDPTILRCRDAPAVKVTAVYDRPSGAW